MVISHNMLAMNANRMFGINANAKAKSTEKLSSGYKINRSADDAAGLAISEKMRRQIRGLTQASDNCQDGIAFSQVADGALNEVHEMLQRINELAVQSANGTNSPEDRKYLDMEVQQIKEEMARVFDTTEFNGHNIWRSIGVPEVERNSDPLDFILYNDTQTGRIGGVAVNNVRYSWRELGIQDCISDDGTRFETGGKIEKVLPGGEMLALEFKRGDSLDKISRIYKWNADKNGIIINNNTAKQVTWNQMNLDPANVKNGTYHFDYAGSTISFKIEDADSIDDVVAQISGDSNFEITWQTVYADTSKKTALNLDSFSQIAFTQSNQKYLLDTGWRMKADQNGVRLTSDRYPAAHTTMAWKDFKDETTNRNPIADWGLRSEVTNAVSLDDQAQYKYTDAASGFHFKFHIQDETSREAAINSINDTPVDKQFLAASEATSYSGSWNVNISSTDAGVSHMGNGSLDVAVNTDRLSFGMQNVLGRYMYTDASYSTKAGISSRDDVAKSSVYSFSITGNDTNYSTAKTAIYEAAIRDDDLEQFIKNGGKQNITLTLQNGAALLADATPAELVEGIKGVDSQLNAQMDFDALSTSYNKALQERKDAYDLDRVKNGWTQAKEDKWKEDNAKILEAHCTAAIAALGSTAAPASTLSSSFDAKQAVAATQYNLNDTDAYATDFGFKVNPPMKRLDIQAGAESYQLISLKWKPLNLSVLAMKSTNVKTESASQAAIQTVKGAMEEISLQRSHFGAQQNRMEHTIKNLDNVVENTTAAESQIRDTDMAREMVKFSNLNVLSQAGQSVLAQANQSKQGILTLLQ